MKKNNGFTLIELLLAIALFSFLVGGVFVSLSAFFGDNQFKSEVRSVGQMLRKAQSNSTQRIKDSQWGVYFDTATNTAILFRGNSYSTRDELYDEIHKLAGSLHFGDIELNSGGTEVVFSKGIGATDRYGQIAITNTGAELSIISINKLGRTEIP